MSIHRRDTFLANISRKLGRPRPSKPTSLTLPYDTHHQVLSKASADELVAQFKSYSESALGMAVEVVRSKDFTDHFYRTCQHYLTNRDQEVVLASCKRLAQLINTQTLVERGLRLYHWDARSGYETNIKHAEQARIGVVFAEQALTESGTLVLSNTPEQGRAISLLPEVTLFIVAKSTLVPRMTQAMEQLHDQAAKGARMPSCINLISGPSSTADIELIKVVGVHGPLQVCTLILDDL